MGDFMSCVTDIILVTMIEDKHECGKLNADTLSQFLIDNHRGTSLVHIPRNIGRRGLQCDVFVTAVNYLDIDEFMRLFYGIEWQYPDFLQLMIKSEYDKIFTVHNYKSRFLVMP